MARAFWKRVDACTHEVTDSSPNYSALVYCDVCSNANEWHCLKCGAYVTECRCGDQSGISGWSHKRWAAHWKRRTS